MSISSLLKKARSKKSGYFAWTRYSKEYRNLPLDDHLIWFESKHGDDIGGNILYLMQAYVQKRKAGQYENLKARLTYAPGKGRRIAALLKQYGLEQEVEMIARGSPAYYRTAATAKYLFNDTSFNPFFIKKEGQVYLNTWHGTPLKKMGRADGKAYEALGNIQRNFLMADYLLHPNDYTKQHMVEDYMLANISSAKTVLCGYPRVAALHDYCQYPTGSLILQAGIDPSCKVYAYIPTWRDFEDKVVSARAKTRLMSHLIEMDDLLADDEVVLLKIHPLERKSVDFAAFRHIRPWPEGLDLYDVLSQCKALVTDYSSIFFDAAGCPFKTILFAYDQKEYMDGRGLYMDLDSLPFCKVTTPASLVQEMRLPKNYDDSAFRALFGQYDRPDAANCLLDLVLKGETGNLRIEPIQSNGKENVLFYSGNLAKNGITTAALSCLHNVDTTARNYILTYPNAKLGSSKTNLLRLDENVIYMPITGKTNMTLCQKAGMTLFRLNLLPAPAARKLIHDVYSLEIQRLYPGVRIDHAVQYMGYEWKKMLLFKEFNCPCSIFVHNNMVEELSTKTNCHYRTLRECYRRYDNVAVVTEDIKEPTAQISGRKDNIVVVNNTVNFEEIRQRAMEPLTFDRDTACRLTQEQLEQWLSDGSKIFLNIGRFSSEKGQKRLMDAFARVYQQDKEVKLVIVGGYGALFKELCDYAQSLECADNIVLIRSLSNPHPLMKKCSWFVLGSTHEGLGLVLLEASVHGLPVFSTDIPGPSGFMKENDGLLVENSLEGVYQGMCACLRGEVGVLAIDEKKYNAAGIQQFERLVQPA